MKKVACGVLAAGLFLVAGQNLCRAQDVIRLGGTGSTASVSNLTNNGEGQTQQVWLLRRLFCWGGGGYYGGGYGGYGGYSGYGGYGGGYGGYGGCSGYGGYGGGYGGYGGCYGGYSGYGGYGGGYGGYGSGYSGYGGYGGYGSGYGGYSPYGGGYGYGGYSPYSGGYGGGYGGYSPYIGGGYGYGGYSPYSGGGYGYGGYGCSGYGGYGGYPISMNTAPAGNSGIAPAPQSQTYPYNGGPANPVPQPGVVPQAPSTQPQPPTVPREGLTVSLPRQTSGGVYPLFMPAPQSSAPAVAVPSAPSYRYKAYGE
jgi:hypothetical protein